MAEAGSKPSAKAALPPLPPEYLDLPDEQLALKFWGFWVGAWAEKRGVPADLISPLIYEQIRVLTLLTETRTEPLSGIEKALQIIAARGNLARAGSLIRQHLQHDAIFMAAIDEVKRGTRRQRAVARKPRQDALQRLIVEAMRAKPGIAPADLVEHLRRIEGQGVIETVTDEQVEWTAADGRAKETDLSALPARMSRARRTISKVGA